jgi:hypothetical protein
MRAAGLCQRQGNDIACVLAHSYHRLSALNGRAVGDMVYTPARLIGRPVGMYILATVAVNAQ